MDRGFDFEENVFYHIYNRGVEKRTIFHDDNDKLRFQRMLYLANGDKPVVFSRLRGELLESNRGEARVSLAAYALMSNHFHLVVSQRNPGGISAFMAKLSTSYSMYFNIKNERSGALLCHPFRAKRVDNDDYFRWLMSYVHLNPLDLFAPGWKGRGIADPALAKKFLSGYSYSSYQDYFGPTRIENRIIDKEILPFDPSYLENMHAMLKEFKDRPDQISADGW